MASAIDSAMENDKKYDADELRWTYIKALGTRYNVWEVVSAFHKELRRADFAKAWFWGNILMTKRSSKGVAKYMLNIIYEETRDHDLADSLISLAGLKQPSPRDIHKHIAWFCRSIKKWELNHRYDVFENEMRGYAWHHRIDLFNMLMEIAESDQVDAAMQIGEIVMRRLSKGFPVGYHELNAIGDALMGEHYMGKHLLRKHPEQLEPRAKQKNLDFRICGAYYGVCWRTLAYEQFDTIDVEWHKVKWPKHLHKTVSDLWY